MNQSIAISEIVACTRLLGDQIWLMINFLEAARTHREAQHVKE